MARRRQRGGEAERITIIVVIAIAMLTVAAATAIHFFNTPENNVKSKMDSMISDYYENFFYENIIKYGTTKESLSRTMEKFKEPGFSRVFFRQLFLYDGQKNAEAANYIRNYCDENASFVIIYPDPPYGRTDYHTKINYSCDF